MTFSFSFCLQLLNLPALRYSRLYFACSRAADLYDEQLNVWFFAVTISHAFFFEFCPLLLLAPDLNLC